MTMTCREQLVRLARRYNALIISDDVYDFLNWGPTPSPLAWSTLMLDSMGTRDAFW